jgi:hypothetical protein
VPDALTSWLRMLPATIAFTFAAGALSAGVTGTPRLLSLFGLAGVLLVAVSLVPRRLRVAAAPSMIFSGSVDDQATLRPCEPGADSDASHRRGGPPRAGAPYPLIIVAHLSATWSSGSFSPGIVAHPCFFT